MIAQNTKFILAFKSLSLVEFFRPFCLQIKNVRGGSRIFVRRGCTRLLLYFNTNKPHSFVFLQNTSCIRKPRSSQGGVRTPCTLPLHPPLNVSFPLDSSNDAVINVFFHVRTDHDGRGSFLEGYKKYCGAGWSMEQKPHESFKSIRNKNILFRNIYSNLNRHIF